MQPKKSPGPIPPKKSPITFPIAAPQAAAGPNRNEQMTGTALAGRSSVTPGMIGSTLKGIRMAAYSDAQIAAKTTRRVLSHTGKLYATPLAVGSAGMLDKNRRSVWIGAASIASVDQTW